jgi:hypothetical protein
VHAVERLAVPRAVSRVGARRSPAAGAGGLALISSATPTSHGRRIRSAVFPMP